MGASSCIDMHQKLALMERSYQGGITERLLSYSSALNPSRLGCDKLP